MRILVLGLSLLSMAASAWAEVRPASLFANGMVLQRGRTVPVWGTADQGEEVTVRFRDQTKTATAEDGRWRVELEPMDAGGPFEMVIEGENSITLADVLVGEVWICSGQSNMQWPVSVTEDAEATISGSANPRIRLFSVPRKSADDPQTSVDGAWVGAAPESVASFSAVGYYFGRALEQALEVPVGLINTSFGGTPAEAWTSREALESNPLLASILERPTPKRRPLRPNDKNRPTGLYNAMISPLIPYAIRGAIWYQGESNASRAAEYFELFPTMISDWRERWGQGDFPFFFVQLAPFKSIVDQPTESAWAELREAQRHTLDELRNTGMAVITEFGDEKDIHPRRKQPVGERLALLALKMAYGHDIVAEGPTLSRVRIDGSRAILDFENIGGGLVAKDGPLTGFTIAGADRQWHKADAKIDGTSVVVSSSAVAEPIAVRFGWADYPVVNLFNEAGLPASPFRTDDFPLTTATGGEK